MDRREQLELEVRTRLEPMCPNVEIAELKALVARIVSITLKYEQLGATPTVRSRLSNHW